MTLETPDSRAAFDAAFPDEDAARRLFARMRWPNGEECQHCASRDVRWLRTRPLLHCRTCRGQTSLRSGTPLHGTRKPLRDWLYALWRCLGHRCVNAVRLQRELGYSSYEAAWSMLHKLRAALVHSGDPGLRGPDVVVDYHRVAAPLPARGAPGRREGVLVALAADAWRLQDPVGETRVVVAPAHAVRPDAVHDAAVEQLTEPGTPAVVPPPRADGSGDRAARFVADQQRSAIGLRASALRGWLVSRFQGVSARYLVNYVHHWQWSGPYGWAEPLGPLVGRLLREPHRPRADLAVTVGWWPAPR